MLFGWTSGQFGSRASSQLWSSRVIISQLKRVVAILQSRLKLALFLVSVIGYQPSAQPPTWFGGGGGAGFSFRASFPYMTAVSVLISSTCLGLKLEFPFPMWFIVSPTGFQGLLRWPCFAYRWPCLGAHRAFAWGCNCDPKPSPPWYDHCCLAAYLACALFTVSHHIWRSFPYLPPGDASDRGWSPCTLEYYNPSTRNCILCGIKGVL